jgi:hypothetical protein
MHTEIFEIEFQVPDVEEQYITFELWVKGMWTMGEIGGGEMRECLVIEEEEFLNTRKHKLSNEEQVLIQKWIATNHEAIRKMFTERIKKYED